MLPLLLLDGADTLVYIDPAPELPDRSKPHARKKTVPHRVHSERLLCTGSSKFQKHFSPRVQTRVRKQRGLAEKLPDGIKYVIDLTPVNHEEDAIIFLAEISCPKGVRMWAQFRSKWELPRSCVGGEDDVEELHDSPDPPTPSSTPVYWNERPEETMVETFSRLNKSPPLPVEYSASRHRQGIEMMLHALEGLHPKIDTPCKLWTFFSVANLFEVAAVPAISDHILSWFYMDTNTLFIEIHPEVAYRVACGIKSAVLCRDAFVGLVGDEALLYLVKSAGLTPLDPLGAPFAHSRIQDFLDDTERDRIEYASKSFADHVIERFLNLVGAKMDWLEGLAEIQKLNCHSSPRPADLDAVSALIATLKDYVRSKLYTTLCHNPDTARTDESTPKPRHARHSDIGTSRNLFEPIDILQRILGKPFWRTLEHLSLGGDAISWWGAMSAHQSIADVGKGMHAFREHEHATIRRVTIHELRHQVAVYNLRVMMGELDEQSTNEAVQPANDLQVWNVVTDLHRLSPPFPDSSSAAGSHGRLVISEINPAGASPGTEVEYQAAPLSIGSSSVLVTNLRRPVPESDLQSPTAAGKVDSSDTLGCSVDNPIVLGEPGPTLQQDFIPADSFELHTCFQQISNYLAGYARKMLFSDSISSMSHDITQTLTCLTDKEYQVLPLWAGGNDDGTGGVFTDHDIPNMESGGFSAPGPAVHMGSLASTEDSFSEIHPSDAQSTIQRASHHATNSHLSELMSVESSDDAQNATANRGSHIHPVSVPSQTDGGIPTEWSTDEFDGIDMLSDSASTVVDHSPTGSIVIPDIDLAVSDDDDDDDDDEPDFEIVDEHT